MKKLLLAIVLAVAAIIVVSESSFATPSPVPQRQAATGVRTYLLKTGTVESIATYDGQTLVVDDGTHQYSYQPMNTLDSQDGQFLGFYSRALDKTIRFPIAGGGRIQVEGAYNNWQWSQMMVTPIATQVATPAQTEWQMHEQIDQLALEVQRQAEEVSNEARLHYQFTPEFAHLISDSLEFQTLSKRLHNFAHLHARPAQLAAEAAKLDDTFHHLEKTFDRIEANAAQGHGQVHGHTSHVKQLLNSMENNLHQIQQRIDTLQRHVVLRPTFGTFANTENLAHQLETVSNEFLLDMHHNYSHNHGYKQTYAEAYQIMTAAKNIESLAHRHDHVRVQQALAGMDQLVHHLDDDIKHWTDRHGRGNTGLDGKLHEVEEALESLMDDAGVRPTAPAPAVQPGIAPPPQP